MHFEQESTAPRYWLCTFGFWVAGLSLGLLSLSGALMLWVVLTADQGLFLAIQQPWFTWAVELPITAGALVGSYLLWGRWTDASWQRRAGLLVLMNLFDSINWGISQAGQMGVQVAAMEHEWMLYNVAMIFGWAEFYLFADLAAEVASHLGVRAAHDAGRTARQFSVAGLVLSALFFATQTRWNMGWPLVPGPMPNLPAELMRLGVTFLRVIASLQVALLCLIAGRSCRRTARQLAQEESELAGTAHLDGTGRADADRGKAPPDDRFSW